MIVLIHLKKTGIVDDIVFANLFGKDQKSILLVKLNTNNSTAEDIKEEAITFDKQKFEERKILQESNIPQDLKRDNCNLVIISVINLRKDHL